MFCVNLTKMTKLYNTNNIKMAAAANYKAISLFSGMGGDTLGMKNAGIDVVAFSEYIKEFQDTHLANFPDSKMLGEDVKSNILKIPDSEFEQYRDQIDFIFAGFPCQSFSTGGKRKVDDPRNTMFREFVRAAEKTNAKVIIGENVKGLLTKKTESGELYIDVIKSEFERLGYDVIFQLFACHKYGIPQKRERLVILGIKKELVENGTFHLKFPKPTTEKSADWKGLRDIIKFSMEGTKKVDSDIFDFAEIPTECVITNRRNNKGESNPHPYLVLKCDTDKKEYGGKSFTTLFSFAKRDSPIHCEIIDIRKPAKTIICTYDHQPRFFVPQTNRNGNYLRMLLPDELKQIQGFPADYIMCGNQKKQIVQIGNAVPPPLIEMIAKTIISGEE